MNFQQKALWRDRRMRIRALITRVLGDIRDGRSVDEIDLDKLHNFCMTMMFVLAKVSPGTLDSAMRDAEIASFIDECASDEDLEERNGSESS